MILTIQQKNYDMNLYAYQVLSQFPKSEKYALGADIKHTLHKITELIIVAKKKYFKKTTLQDLDVSIEKLRLFIRMGYDLKFINMHKYKTWIKLVIEIGRMVGGWMKHEHNK